MTLLVFFKNSKDRHHEYKAISDLKFQQPIFLALFCDVAVYDGAVGGIITSLSGALLVAKQLSSTKRRTSFTVYVGLRGLCFHHARKLAPQGDKIASLYTRSGCYRRRTHFRDKGVFTNP